MTAKPKITHISIEGQPSYECTDCGHEFLKDEGGGAGSLCPECGKAGSRQLDLAARCPLCEDIINLEDW